MTLLDPILYRLKIRGLTLLDFIRVKEQICFRAKTAKKVSTQFVLSAFLQYFNAFISLYL